MKTTTDSKFKDIYLLYNRYHGYLLEVGLHYRWPREVVMDIINQLFLDLIEKKVEWDNIVNPKAYILTAFKRRLIDQSRKNKRLNRLYHTIPPDSLYEPSAEEKITEEQINAETLQKIKTAYQKLPYRCQRAIYMKFYEGLGTEEIAEKCGLTARSVYNNLFEGIKILRREMKEVSGKEPTHFFSLLFSIF